MPHGHRTNVHASYEVHGGIRSCLSCHKHRVGLKSHELCEGNVVVSDLIRCLQFRLDNWSIQPLITERRLWNSMEL